MAEQNADQAPSRWRAFLGKANAMSGTPAGILAFNHARLLGIISVGAFLAVIVGCVVSYLTLPVHIPVYAAFGVALVCFGAVPFVVRKTGSTSEGALLLLLGSVGPIFVPAYYQDGIRSPHLIGFAVIVMLVPIFLGVRFALITVGVGIAGFTLLYAAQVFAPGAEAMTVTPPFFSYFNLLLASVFATAVGIATKTSSDRGRRDLEFLGSEFEKKAEMLVESSARQTAILNSSLAGIISCDAEGVITDFNPAAQRLFGYSKERAVGKKVRDLIIPVAMQSHHDASFASYLATGVPNILGKSVELVGRCIDGSEIPVEVLVQRIDLPGDPQFTAFVRDLRPSRRSEALLRQREEQLYKARRLEDVGRLAGGVAHDFNNLLTIISGYSESILDEAKVGSIIQEDAQEIASAAERAGIITKQLLAFSRTQLVQLEALDLSRILEGFETTLNTVVPPNIDFSLSVEPVRWRVRGDTSQLERVFMNLVLNACDAIEGGGSVEIILEYIEILEKARHARPEPKPGRYALLEFRDTGSGMSEETLSHAFDPFFTTKGVGKGTGLGLASVYGIIQQCGGQVTIESEEGAGTSVRIFLPDETQPQSVSRRLEQEMSRNARPSILIVDDDSRVRNQIAARLRWEPYRILEAADGEEALAIASQEREDLVLVVSDLVMPVRNGAEVAEEIGRDLPNVKFIFMSGYLEDQAADLLPPGAEFLQKPISSTALLGAVRKLLVF